MSPLPDLVTALLEPAAYPVPPRKIDLVQTQMSFVLVTPEYVFKIKKPVNLGYLDYSTLEKRLFYCQKEVELNRRLCPDTYLEVVAVTQEGNTYAVGGRGRAVEYAVKMRYLPQARMMNVLLAGDRVTPEMVTAVAERVAAFHRAAGTGEAISGFGRLDTIIQNTAENFSQTEKYLGRTLSAERYRRIKSYTETYIAKNAGLFERRVAAGRIRDCHGDLHAAHVCFTDGICIYDCIEFNDRFRYCDVASEVSFLAMDLDKHGRTALSKTFVDAYIEYSGDTEIGKLLDFYKCYRAYVRGKVESFKSEDPYVPEQERAKSAAIAKEYFGLAESYTRLSKEVPNMKEPFRKFVEENLGVGVLLIACGLPATWKTETTEEIARIKGYPILRTDLIRLEVLKNEDVFDSKIASNMDKRMLVYDETFRRADDALKTGDSVILDATFITQTLRKHAAEVAARHRKTFVILETSCPQEVSLRRISRRTKENYESNAITEEAYLNNKKKFEKVDLSDLKHIFPDLKIIHLKVDTTGDPPEDWHIIGLDRR